MSSFFKKHKRTPAELATKLSNALKNLSEGGDDKVRPAKTLAFLRATRAFRGFEDRGLTLPPRPRPTPPSSPASSARRAARSTWARCET